jgi:hypothetical protein
VDGLHDRSSGPLSSPGQIDLVERLRRQRRTQAHLAAELGISKASVSRILKCRGFGRLCSLEPLAPCPSYECEKPGRSSISTSKSSADSKATATASPGAAPAFAAANRQAGNAIDDHSRVARADFPDQKKESGVSFPGTTNRAGACINAAFLRIAIHAYS